MSSLYYYYNAALVPPNFENQEVPFSLTNMDLLSRFECYWCQIVYWHLKFPFLVSDDIDRTICLTNNIYFSGTGIKLYLYLQYSSNYALYILNLFVLVCIHSSRHHNSANYNAFWTVIELFNIVCLHA